MSGPEASIDLLICLVFAAAALVALAACWYVYVDNGRLTRCMSPGCGRPYARVVIGRRLLDKRLGYKIMSEQVQVLRQYWEVYYSYRFCGHRWSKQIMTETANFNL
jgi:hypothetical protein